MLVINDISHVQEVASSVENNVVGGLAISQSQAGAFALGLLFAGTATSTKTFSVSGLFNISGSFSGSQSAAQ